VLYSKYLEIIAPPINEGEEPELTLINVGKEEKEIYEGERGPTGKPEGSGKWTNLETGEYYEGQWENGKRHGVGIEKNPQTSEYYEGQWENGKKKWIWNQSICYT